MKKGSSPYQMKGTKMARYKRRYYSRSRPRKHREWLPVNFAKSVPENTFTKDGSQHTAHIPLFGTGSTGDGVIMDQDEGTIVRLRGELTLSWDFHAAVTSGIPDFIHTMVGFFARNRLESAINRNPYDSRDTDYLAITNYSCVVANNASRQTLAKEIDSKAKRKYEKEGALDAVAGFQYKLISQQSSVGLQLFFAGRVLVEY